MKRKVLIFLALCMVTGAIFEMLPKIFYVNITSSLPMGVYVRVPSTNYRRGDYVVYEPTAEVKNIIMQNKWGNAKYDFLKTIGAVAGDKYSIDATSHAFKIEGKYSGRVYEKDNKGNELPKLRGEFEVPTGYVLPVASGARSFDGRYSGVISQNRIKAKVVPLVTW